MKSNNPRKKLLSDYSSQDEHSLKRSVKAEKERRNRKPSIYDEMDDEDDFVAQLEDDELDGYDDVDEEEDY
ncbi:hypothetical protein LX69_02271 [Breznakibacter xylanolyticus]|uniref:Uncharacterized protein n=1 Tax=Breznakibacter xylanolyticus TaxID=990 RepID=A0A2W7N647_9BACT|nr:hypothetical protein [Breznakibacter xylanolyticus]PZX15183.1 hypothetical protein LX69_02271 [Breznakibacter xylanolyticus]